MSTRGTCLSTEGRVYVESWYMSFNRRLYVDSWCVSQCSGPRVMTSKTVKIATMVATVTQSEVFNFRGPTCLSSRLLNVHKVNIFNTDRV